MYERFEFTVPFHRDKSACEVKIVNRNGLTIVIVKEIGEGMSICNAFEFLLPQVLTHFGLSHENLIWIEYWPKHLDRLDEYSMVSYRLHNSYPFKVGGARWQYLGDSEETAINIAIAALNPSFKQ